MSETSTPIRIALVWRGDPAAPAPEPERTRLANTFAALAERGAVGVPVVYGDEAVEQARAKLLGCDGVLVWVDPLSEGKTRDRLDPLLREVAAAGVYVSAHPDVILKMGTKEVLYATRDLGWGVDTDLYRTEADFRARFPVKLAADGPRVLKQYRGNGGQGVWKVELRSAAANEGAPVEVLHALRGSVTERTTLGAFMDRCRAYFDRDGRIIDQAFQPRLPEGMIRCYMSRGEVAGYGHQLIKALVPPPPEGPASEAAQPGPRIMHRPEAPPFQDLRRRMEDEWVPQMQAKVGVADDELPALWDADFLYARRRPTAATPTCSARSTSARWRPTRTAPLRRPRSRRSPASGPPERERAMLEPRRLMARLVQAAAVLAVSTACGAVGAPLPLTTVKDIPVGAPTGRFDYASLDPKTGLLFVADLAGGRVLAFDVRSERLVKAIGNVPSVHGVLAVPELGRAYASATGAHETLAIDEKTLTVVARSPSGRYPDGIAWDPRERKVYVSDETGGVVAVIDAAKHRLVTTISMNSEVGNTQYDPGSGLIYSNAQTSQQLVGIDPKTDKIVSRDRIDGCEGNHGLLIDAPRRLALIACEGNGRLVLFSLARRAKLGEDSVGRVPDVLAYDPERAWLYVASESGVVSVFRVDPDKLVKLGQELLANNAHVVAVDPSTHRVFFPLRNVAGKAVLRVMAPK
jgi:DNA-binding beta-propeller fold protein YncE